MIGGDHHASACQKSLQDFIGILFVEQRARGKRQRGAREQHLKVATILLLQRRQMHAMP